MVGPLEFTESDMVVVAIHERLRSWYSDNCAAFSRMFPGKAVSFREIQDHWHYPEDELVGGFGVRLEGGPLVSAWLSSSNGLLFLGWEDRPGEPIRLPLESPTLMRDVGAAFVEIVRSIRQ